MNKNTIIWIICAVVVVAVGFFAFKAMHKAPAGAATETATGTDTASSTQVQAQEVTVGTGAEAAPGSQVSVLYVGQLADGTVFDSSAAHNNEPYTFVLGSSAEVRQSRASKLV